MGWGFRVHCDSSCLRVKKIKTFILECLAVSSAIYQSTMLLEEEQRLCMSSKGIVGVSPLPLSVFGYGRNSRPILPHTPAYNIMTHQSSAENTGKTNVPPYFENLGNLLYKQRNGCPLVLGTLF